MDSVSLASSLFQDLCQSGRAGRKSIIKDTKPARDECYLTELLFGPPDLSAGTVPPQDGALVRIDAIALSGSPLRSTTEVF